MFVHTRNKWYVELGLLDSLDVYVPARGEKQSYVYDGVRVHICCVEEIIKNISSCDVVFAHLLHVSHDPKVDGGRVFEWMLSNDFPFVMFIHGVESQSILKSRPDDISIVKPKSIARWLYRDFYLLRRFSGYLRRMCDSKRVRVVTPSVWMARDVEFNTGVNIESKASIIPNGVDTEQFIYRDSLWRNREKIMSIRPLYYRGKYAVDLFLDTAESARGQGRFYLYGRGPDEDMITRLLLERCLGVSLNTGFLENSKIPKLHAEHGLYYAVTRMDAQGVSMCEAMSSGLPVISFDVCAIPEFIEDGVDGFLVKPYDVVEAFSKMQLLWEDRSLFDRISTAARKRAEAIDIRITVSKEIALGGEIVSA